jgi:hypothetical protein
MKCAVYMKTKRSPENRLPKPTLLDTIEVPDVPGESDHKKQIRVHKFIKEVAKENGWKLRTKPNPCADKNIDFLIVVEPEIKEDFSLNRKKPVERGGVKIRTSKKSLVKRKR